MSGRIADGVSLELPLAYKVLAPICDILDTMSLFSQGQHLAFLITCALGYTLWRSIRRHRKRADVGGARVETTAAAKAFLALLILYAGGTLVPRPVAKLVLSSPDALVVDFHSHTRYSWDGRSGFSPEQSRRWHRASGFDVAYVTDHSTFAGAEQAALGNPVHAGDGTVMLSGIEVRDRGSHVVVLGTDARDWQSYTAGSLHEHTFQREVKARGSMRPVILFALPGNLKSEAALSVDAVELSDAAPRGLAQTDAEHTAIVRLAQNQHKTLIASSNNHGWASATPAWSVMNIHNWRTMTPSQIDTAIRREILYRENTAVTVISRRQPGPVSFPGLAMTVPLAASRMLGQMSWPERFSWLTWIWLSYFFMLAFKKLRRDGNESRRVLGVAAITIATVLPRVTTAQMLETETARPLRAGQVEAGLGYEFQHSREGDEIAIPISFEFGLSNRLGLLVEPVPYTAIRPEVGTSATGVGDLEITASYLFRKESAKIPALAIAFEEKIPTARNTLIGSGKADHTAYLIASKAFGRVDTHMNIGYSIIGSPPGQSLANRVMGALAAELSLSPTILYAEVLGSTNTGGGEGTPASSGTTPSPEAGGDEFLATIGVARNFGMGRRLSLGLTRDQAGAWQVRPGITLWFH
ncbi:MAG TPA: hypothetical protein VJS39_05825 [Gemmatimonadaceae bacterium]|nr:hypothetical protein [Gemmatimonadaceae bacterium]